MDLFLSKYGLSISLFIKFRFKIGGKVIVFLVKYMLNPLYVCKNGLFRGFTRIFRDFLRGEMDLYLVKT